MRKELNSFWRFSLVILLGIIAWPILFVFHILKVATILITGDKKHGI